MYNPELFYELNTPVAETEFQVIKKAYELNSSDKRPAFNYAWVLIRSNNKDAQVQGVNLLTQIYKTIEAEKKKEALFFLTLGNFKLKKYELSLKYIDSLINAEDDLHNDTSSLRIVRDKIKEEISRTAGTAFVGLTIGVGLLAAGLTVANKWYRTGGRK
ncbi:hypothetical protein FOG51_03790 [Hanseniaspora uvarum]|nr:hypothetical protein FOG48_00953 [Hanseniaspora uvarum]KAF0271289.1 hypothetical protein FOG51_03790 [Hanseniaspora uvarum]KAF0276722.1 hypothetical protein FOG50_02464 [Hanseniaspora uvarum]